MRKETRNWLDTAEYDLVTAEHMFNTGRYIYVVYMCHLALEKALKAVVNEESGQLPPKSHDLLYLAKLGVVEFPGELLDFVGKLNGAHIATRYPEDLQRMLSVFTEEIAAHYLAKTREAVTWLKQDSRLKG